MSTKPEDILNRIAQMQRLVATLQAIGAIGGRPLMRQIAEALTNPTNRKYQEPGPSILDMLGGRQKGVRIEALDGEWIDTLMGNRPFSESPEPLKAQAKAAILAGELAPNCEDPDCDFCTWVRSQDEWLAVVARGAGRVGDTDMADAAKVVDEVLNDAARQAEGKGGDDGVYAYSYIIHDAGSPGNTVPGILREAAATYEGRNPLYGDAYKHYGATMMGFFPNGMYINEPEDWNRFGLFSMMVSKMTRIAANLATGGHRDSSLDLSVYAAMMTELTEQK